MRLLIRLRCTEDSPYEMQYHYHLQGFIYNLLKGSKYDYVHDKDGYKFFCFSNIFPANTLHKGDLRTLIISSPDNGFVEHIHSALQYWNGDIKIGAMTFEIDSVDRPGVKLSASPLTLITGTPIVIRIPRERYRAYGIEPKGQYDSVYWRSDYPVDLFISQIENNLTKKYTEYFGLGTGQDFSTRIKVDRKELPSIHFIQKFKFKKQVSTKVLMKGFDQVVIGTTWEFEFDAGANMDIIRFAIDSGLGERNSLGFGFMNIINK